MKENILMKRGVSGYDLFFPDLFCVIQRLIELINVLQQELLQWPSYGNTLILYLLNHLKKL